MERVSVHQVTLGKESAFVVVTKPARGRTKNEIVYFKRPSKQFKVLLSDRKKIESLINDKPT